MAPMQGNAFPVERNDILMWFNLKNITLTERSQTQRSHAVRMYLCEISSVGKSREIESKLVVASGLAGDGLYLMKMF